MLMCMHVCGYQGLALVFLPCVFLQNTGMEHIRLYLWGFSRDLAQVPNLMGQVFYKQSCLPNPSKLNSLTKILSTEVQNPNFHSGGIWKHTSALNFDNVIDYMVNYTGVW